MQKETKKSGLNEKLGAKAVSGTNIQADLKSLAHAPIISSSVHRAPKHKNLKILLIFSVFLGVLAGGSGLFFTTSHKSFAKIYLGSLPLNADASPSQIKILVESANKNYQLPLQYTDGTTKSYPLSTVGVTFDSPSTVKNVQKTLSSLSYQRFQWWQPVNIKMSTKINKNTLRAFIDGQATQAKKAAADATLTISEGKAVITPEVPGEGDSVQNPEIVIPSVAAIMKTSPIKLKKGSVEPAIKTGDLEASKKKLDSILSQQVVLNIDSKSITAKPTDIAGWVELTPVKGAKTVDVTVNSGKIVKYIDLIAKPYVQPPRSRLIVNTPDGQQVLDPGKNGIDVINKDQAASLVSQAVSSGKGVNTNLDVKYATAKTVEVQPYDKWIVVDVTTKRMYAYEQTNLVRSFLVSAGAPKTPTVLGQYHIYSKTVKQDMRGFNADGSRYFQPRVPYVNYFYKDYAIHGNYWRPASYFGNINSSHGCVGVQVTDGEWLYSWAPVGTPVIVHN